MATSAAKHALNQVRELICLDLINMTQYNHIFRLLVFFVPFASDQCTVCEASCSYLAINDEVGEFDIIRAAYCLILIYTSIIFFLCGHISVSDEAAGKSLFQGPSEAHPIPARPHLSGLSPVGSVHLAPFPLCFSIVIAGC